MINDDSFINSLTDFRDLRTGHPEIDFTGSKTQTMHQTPEL